MSMFLFPGFLFVLFLGAMVLVFLIPGKNSDSKRALAYHRSFLVKLTYIYSFLLVVGGLIFGGILYLGFYSLKNSFMVAGTLTLTVAGLGLFFSNYLGVKHSKRKTMANIQAKHVSGIVPPMVVRDVGKKSARVEGHHIKANMHMGASFKAVNEQNEKRVAFQVTPLEDE